LLVLFGGHDSCAPGPLDQVMAKPFFALQQSMPQSAYVASCYGALTYTAHVRRSGDDGRVAERSNEELIADVIALARATDEHAVAIVGHSYGGWLALQTALALPPDVRLVSLTTIDPISQRSCVRPLLGIRAVSEALGDATDAACQRFPDDVGAAQRARLARSTIWRNYFQDRTRLLRSGPAPEAATNGFFAVPHAAIGAEPGIWRRVQQDVAGTPAPAVASAGETLLAPDAARAWLAREEREHPRPEISELSWRLFTRYAKSTFSLYGRRGDDTVATYQPNVRPSAGLAVQFTANHGFSAAHSLDFIPTGDGKIKTRATAYEYRYTQRRWIADAFYHDYRGLIRSESHRGDPGFFGDSLFHAVPASGNRPGMRLRSWGLGGLWLLDPGAVSLPAMLTQKERHAADGWTLIVEGSYRDIAVRGGDDPEVPAFRAYTLSVLPGIAAALVFFDDWSLSGTVVWGPAYRRLAGQAADAFAENGGARVAVGRNGADWFYGATGQKRITSAAAKVFAGRGLSDAFSSIDLYAGRHF
jgi:pimeloyl-ACP methyl ester carboxylesterase